MDNVMKLRYSILKLSIVHCPLSIVLFFFLFSFSVFAEDVDEAESPEEFTREVALAIKYDRCEDALNLLMDKERAEDSLSTQHRYLMAEAFSCMGSFKTAVDIYSELLKHDKDNVLYLHRRVGLYAQLESWKKAYMDCVHLRKLMPPYEYSYCKLCGEISQKAERYADAVAFLNCHLQVAVYDEDARYVMAMAYQGLKDYGNALPLINTCIAAKPQMGLYRLARAQMYEETGVLNFAADDYAAYLKQFSTDHKVWLQYALLLQKLNRKEDMCKAFEQSKANGNLDAGRYQYRFCK